MKNTCDKTDYLGYHAYLTKHIFNINMDTLAIHHMTARQINITTTKKYLL